jgi:DNA replication protein DnaC
VSTTIDSEITAEEAERRRQEKAKTVNLTGVKYDRCKPCFGTGQSKGAKCDTCDGTGKVAAKTMQESLDALRSSVAVKRIEDEVADAHERTKQIRVLFASSGVPDRHAHAIQLDYSGEWSEKLAAAKARLSKGFLIALIGEWGNGKTQFGVELIRENCNRLRTSMFATATDFFMDIKATYKPANPSDEKAVIKRYSEPTLLVIDEIAKRGESDWENNLLFHLVNRRYNSKLDTVLIANQAQSDFDKSVGPSLVRRLNETGGVINCLWPAFV